MTATETSAKPTSFRFAGGLYSSSVALHKFGERWYDQSLDRWTQQDPIDQSGDLQDGNRYLYVGQDPVNNTDPSGTWTVCDWQGCKASCGWHECTGDSPRPLSPIERGIIGCYKGTVFGGIGEPYKAGKIGAAGCITGAAEGIAGG
jgi:RHS repeat-associated protein